MFYLYHHVPKNLQGTTLYPLNQLKTFFPDIYTEAIKKYIGRENVMDQVIPGFDWKWNDVIHMSPVHPQEIKKALNEIGVKMEGTFFEINPSLLEKENTILFLYVNDRINTMTLKKEFVPFDPALLESLSVLPQGAKDYYQEVIKKGERPLLWHQVPHILYKGTLDTTKLKRITI